MILGENLLTETLDRIRESGHEPKEIVFIGVEETGEQCTWDEFRSLANREYDSGYGGQEVRADLIIVFSDETVMRREEYDGKEWWELVPKFRQPHTPKLIKTLFGCY